jgi:hypothetical protein
MKRGKKAGCRSPVRNANHRSSSAAAAGELSSSKSELGWTGARYLRIAAHWASVWPSPSSNTGTAPARIQFPQKWLPVLDFDCLIRAADPFQHNVDRQRAGTGCVVETLHSPLRVTVSSTLRALPRPNNRPPWEGPSCCRNDLESGGGAPAHVVEPLAISALSRARGRALLKRSFPIPELLARAPVVYLTPRTLPHKERPR